MNLHVLLKIRARGEGFIAELTVIGLLSCVNSFVAYEITNLYRTRKLKNEGIFLYIY